MRFDSRRKVRRGLPAMLCCLAVGIAAAQSPEERTKQALDLILARKYDQFYSQFSPEMKKAISLATYSAQADQIQEASSAGRERTGVRDRPSSGADAELGGDARIPGHRSTSPSTMSMEPITATRSGSSSPLAMWGRALRLLKEGARTLQR